MHVGHHTISKLIDANIVDDYCPDYGEPGYSKEDPNGLIIFGNMWCRKRDCGYEGAHGVHSVEEHYPRLFTAMAEQGIEFQWGDEWIIDHNSGKAYRIQGDSYSWQSSIMWTKYGDVLFPDDDITEWIEAAANNPRAALPGHVWTDEQLGEHGFSEYQCGYQNGWYGQEDNPVEISKIITAEYAEQDKEVDILFKLSYVAQFDLGFCVFVRERDED